MLITVINRIIQKKKITLSSQIWFFDKKWKILRHIRKVRWQKTAFLNFGDANGSQGLNKSRWWFMNKILTVFWSHFFFYCISTFVNLKKWWYFANINFVFGNNPFKSYWAFPLKSHFSVLSSAMVSSSILALKPCFI